MSFEWQDFEIGELCSVTSSKRIFAHDYVDCGVPFYASKDVIDKSFGLFKGSEMYISHKRFSDIADKFGYPSKGDLLLSSVGNRAGIAYVVGDEGKFYFKDGNITWFKNFNSLSSDFLCYWLKSGVGQSALQSIMIGSAQKALTISGLLKLRIKIPSLLEQDRIVAILSALDDRITLLRETNANLEAIAQALFKSWFVDFDPVRAKAEGLEPQAMDAPTAALFPDSFEESELGLVPKGWKVMPFLDVCDLQGGAQPPASTFIDEPRDGYVRLLQIRDFSTDAHKTYIPDTKKLKKVTEDDVLIGRYGSASGDKAKDSLGRVCRGLSGSYNVALMKLSPVQVGKEFAFQLVSDAGFYGYLQGVSSKAVQSGFSKSELGQYKVVVPPRELAEQFEQFGEVIWKSVKENRKQAQTLSHLRDTLLPRLISGQLRLPEAETEIVESTR